MMKVGTSVHAIALSAILSAAWIPQAFAQSGAAPARVEETDPSVSYTVGWTQGDSSKTWSGGTAAVSTAPGAQATLTFTGTSVSWIGGRTPATGIARVSLDGVFLTDVDTYSKTEEIRVAMFSVNGLANTSHALTIEVTGGRNSAATSNLIVIDAFDTPAPAVSRLQETDSDATYTGTWVQDNPVYVFGAGVVTGFTQGNSLRAWSAGAATLSTAAGSRATFAFSGTSVSWIGARGTQSGIARVFLDGAPVAEVDCYSPTEQVQAEGFAANGLANTGHTLTIEVTGRQNAASGGALIVVDAFEVSSPGIQVQDTDPAIVYNSGWIQGNRDKAYSQGATAETVTPGAQATFTFTGTGIAWIGARGPQTGIALVYVDGAFVDQIDTYAPTEAPQHTVFATSGLAPGTHTLTVVSTGMRNPLSVNSWILVDAFDVVP